MNSQSIIDAIKRADKERKWLSCHFVIEHNGKSLTVGVKAYGKWVQRIESCGLSDSIPEQKSWKALQSELDSVLSHMVLSLSM